MLILLVLGLLLAAPLKATDGNDLLDRCSRYLRFQVEGKIPEDDKFDVAWCIGFVDGAVRMAKALGEAKVAARLFCVPENATTGQTILVVTNYLQEHPETLHQLAMVQIVAAMHEAFPCRGG